MNSIDTAAKIDKSAADVLKRNNGRRELAKRLFSTTDGDKVYEWLMDQFYHNQHIETDEVKLSRHAGRRDVMVLLRGIVEK